MALETLTGKNFGDYVTVDQSTNTISFKIQDGPIEENGLNGCQVDDLVRVAKCIVMGLNKKFPCSENDEALLHMNEVLHLFALRKRNRELRGVEGYNKT